MKKIYQLIAFIFPFSAFCQQAIVDVSPDKYQYQSQSIGNQLRQLYHQEKQTLQQSKLAITAVETYNTTKEIYTDINQLAVMQKKLAEDYQKFNRILDFNQQDLDCIFKKMGQMFISGLPKSYNGNLGNMMKFDCSSNAVFLYNLLNPYNSYGKETTKYSVLKSKAMDPKTYSANFKKTLSESNQANLALRDLEKKNNVELAAMYSQMSEEEMRKAKKIYLELSLESDRKPEVEFQMVQQADAYLRQSMEHKRLSLELLTALKENKTELEKVQERRENARFLRSQLAETKPMTFGNH